MPELPEVETIVNDLNKKIKGDTIVGFWSDVPAAIKNATIDKFKKEIKGRKILQAHRIGKNMFIDLSGEKTMYIHLKMTGHLLVKDQGTVGSEQYFSDKVNQYIHHIWRLQSKKLKVKSKNDYDKTLEFSDLRKFAKIILLDTPKIKEYKDIINLGVDAMDKKFDFKKFNGILDKYTKTPVGILLMDQNKIAGIGNIYRSEILFDAGVLPVRKVSALSGAEKKKVFNSTKKILKKAVKFRGTSDSDYRDTDGAPGGFQKILSVYNRERQKCKRCGTIILRRKLGGRSVFYCPKCQK